LYNDYTDSQLLQQFTLTKQNEWLSILFKRYTLLVYGVSMKYLKDEQNAKDATQQIFEKCFVELSKYEVTYFKSWLYQITKNYCFMQLRNKPGKHNIDIDTINDIAKSQNETEEKNEIELKNLTLEIMHQCIDELGNEQKQCILLFYIEKKSYDEISTALEISYLQVKSFIQNGKRNLKNLMEKQLQQHNNLKQ
jgi:RNA polymerase sigma factor (sigma-70 family)